MKALGWTAFAVGLYIIGCASSPEHRGVKEADSERVSLAREVKDEIEIGRGVAAKLLGHYGAAREPREVIEYVNLVGQTLVENSGRPELVYRFGVLKSDEINAYAAPGGYIFITTGLLSELSNESELAAVLAHEIAHVNERHMYLAIAPKREVAAGETIARLFSRGHADLGHSFVQTVNQGMILLVEKGLGLEKERAADEAAILYNATAGYDPEALGDFLMRLESKRGKLKVPASASPFSERLVALKTSSRSNGSTKRKVADVKAVDSRFAQAMAALR